MEGTLLSLRTLNRKVKMDYLHQDGDVCELLFNGRRAQHACRLFLDVLRKKKGLTRAEFHRFTMDLGAGRVEAGFRYSKVRFYMQVRRTLLTLGLVGIESRPADSGAGELEPEMCRRRGVIDKYVAVWQPISKRPPDGLNLVRLTWILCDRWNWKFFERSQERVV
jgi:hypothetical protein